MNAPGLTKMFLIVPVLSIFECYRYLHGILWKSYQQEKDLRIVQPRAGAGWLSSSRYTILNSVLLFSLEDSIPC